MQNYSLKNLSNVEVEKVNYYAVFLEDMEAWLNTGNTFEYTVVKSAVAPALVITSGTNEVVVMNHDYIVKDSNGKVFMMTQDTLTAFFDPAV